MDDLYDDIAPKPWFAARGHENIYYVEVLGWAHPRQIIERDGLVCFQVTVCFQVSIDSEGCGTCKERVAFVKQQLADQNVHCFWTFDPNNFLLYVTVGPPPQGVVVEIYLSNLLQWPLIMYGRPQKGPSKAGKTKAGSHKRRHIVH